MLVKQQGRQKMMYKSSVNFLFSEDGRTITGTPPAVATTIVEAIGADIIGINCPLDLNKLHHLSKRLQALQIYQ